MGLATVNSQSLTGEPGQQDVRQELERIVASRVFRGSHRCQTFLHYVVSTTLEGESKFLKERTLAVQVFGRSATDDLSDDSIVRVGAREVRKRLAQYYMDEGANSPVRIDLPAGTYIPTFQWRLAASPATIPNEEPLPTHSEPQAPVPPPRRRLRWKLFLLGAAVVVACLAVFAWRTNPGPRSAFDTFWQPAFHENGPLLIAIAHPVVYLPSVRAQKLDEQRNGVPNPPIQRPIHVPPGLLNGSDFVAVQNQYVGLGDAEAALRISSLFDRRHAAWHVRLASKVVFNDLWGSGAVLIGAYTNRWTMEMTKNMRYRFEYNAQQKPCIAEGSAGCRWTLAKKEDNGQSEEDYILLARLTHSTTNGFTVVCAGLNVYGTEEGGRIVSDPDSLAPFLRQLPKNWSSHNLEMVLHVAVVGDAPAQSELVSAYTW